MSINLSAGYKSLIEATINCGARTERCEKKSLKECRMCQYFDYELFLEEQKKTLSKKPLNCPNCGAPLSNGKCEYCGTEAGA